MTGPETITFGDAAEQLSTATGREIAFVDLPNAAARSAMLESGMPAWLADNLVTLFGKLKEGCCTEVNDTVSTLTGCAPRTFANWAGDHAAVFGG